jgi:sec-independent protein translocase protein TatA
MNSLLVVAIAGLGMPELLVILGIIVLIFGASKLPQLGKGLGEGIRNFKSGIKSDADRERLSDKHEDKD